MRKRRNRRQSKQLVRKSLISRRQFVAMERKMSVGYNLTENNIYNHTRESPGIYAVWYEHRLLYVGKSLNVKNRLTDHNNLSLRSSNKILRVWIGCKDGELLFSVCDIFPILGEDDIDNNLRQCESHFIRQWRPECNLTQE